MNWVKLAKKIRYPFVTACIIFFQCALNVYLHLLYIIMKIHIIVFLGKKYDVSVTAMTFLVKISVYS